ncbi:MAG: hypothetical protein JXQ99_04045 [Hyphomicrobiaceae bacterium]
MAQIWRMCTDDPELDQSSSFTNCVVSVQEALSRFGMIWRMTSMHIDAAGQSLPIRAGLAGAIEDAWQRLARAGTWWSGGERISIAAEVRRAATCGLCGQRKVALSPYTIDGGHDTDGVLPADSVEAIHRLATDAGRVTETWVRGIIEGSLGEERYVEIVSIVAIVTALDTFDRALGRAPRELPEPVPGAPSHERPAGAKRNLAWVATLAPEDIQPGDPDPYAVHGDKNIHRAASLVPQEVFNFFDLDVELYLRDHEIRDFAREYRAISHAQIELIAARASSINACFY